MHLARPASGSSIHVFAGVGTFTFAAWGRGVLYHNALETYTQHAYIECSSAVMLSLFSLYPVTVSLRLMKV